MPKITFVADQFGSMTAPLRSIASIRFASWHMDAMATKSMPHLAVGSPSKKMPFMQNGGLLRYFHYDLSLIIQFKTNRAILGARLLTCSSA
jgi:hypothetical protein